MIIPGRAAAGMLPPIGCFEPGPQAPFAKTPERAFQACTLPSYARHESVSLRYGGHGWLSRMRAIISFWTIAGEMSSSPVFRVKSQETDAFYDTNQSISLA